MERDIARAQARYRRARIPNRIPKRLPALAAYCEGALGRSRPFAGMDVLFIQHHLGPFVPRLRTMQKLGLSLDRAWFLDIPYSTCSTVRRSLVRLGCRKDHMASSFDDPIEPYSIRQEDRAEDMIRRILERKRRSPLLVIDDGAYFLRTLRHLRTRDRTRLDGALFESLGRRRLVVVEQTTRGHRYVEKECGRLLRSLRIPVVSIARTTTKKELESPFIGSAVGRALTERPDVLEVLRRPKRVLVIGFGPVGRAVTDELHCLGFHRIDVLDKAYKKLKGDIRAAGARPIERFPERGRYDLVLGCTGYGSLPVRKVNILRDDAVLVSGSSGAVEFNRKAMIDRAYRSKEDDFYLVEPEKTRRRGIHATITMQKGNKRFSFINAGFPVNFTGKMECLPWQLIQITHTLLTAAAVEALSAAPGFQGLSAIEDGNVHEIGLELIARYGRGDATGRVGGRR